MPKKTKAAKARELRRVSELYLKSIPQEEIGKELEISQSTVSRDLVTLRKQWLADASMDFSQKKAQELAKIDELEREYWAAWKRSQSEAVTKYREQVKGGPEQNILGEQRYKDKREWPVGDPAYLRGVADCIEQRCKIMGFLAPVKSDLTSGGMPLPAAQQTNILVVRDALGIVTADDMKGVQNEKQVIDVGSQSSTGSGG